MLSMFIGIWKQTQVEKLSLQLAAKKDDETLTMLIECNVPRAFTFKEIRGKGMIFTWTINQKILQRS